MSLRVLVLFKKNNVEVYALPAYTSGKTQPLYVVAFSVFKAALNYAISTVLQANKLDELDMYAYCALIKDVYYKASTRKNIQASFRRARMWPLDTTRLLNKPRPQDDEDVGTVLSVPELIKLYEQSRAVARQNMLGCEVTFV